MRKMATIRRIDNIEPIEGADAIMVATVGGWKSVIKKEEFKIGDLAIYLEVDSWCPYEYKPELSKGKEPRSYDGIKGERLKTIRLRGQISQGLLLPVSVGIDAFVGSKFDDGQELSEVFFEGNDVSEILNIQKYEPPPEFTSANARGSFPSYGPKSDQERIQNCYSDVCKLFDKFTWTVSEKIEGQSFCSYFYNGEFGVCSRNINLTDSDNTYWNSARKYDLETKLRNLGKNLMVYFEQTGPGIQGNIYGQNSYMLFMFDVFDIDAQSYYSPREMMTFAKELNLVTVPILETDCSLNDMTCDDILKKADGISVLGFTDTLREGLIFKLNSDRRTSWKAVSNSYLLKK